MRTNTVIAGTLLALASTAAMSQDMPRDQSMQRQQQMQRSGNGPAPTPRTGDSSEGGGQSGTSGSGTLMQKREQGMSPESSAAPPPQGSQSTGPIKQ